MIIHFSDAVVTRRVTESNGRTFVNFSIEVGCGRGRDIFCKNVYPKRGLDIMSLCEIRRDFDVNLYSKWDGDKKEWKTFMQILN